MGLGLLALVGVDNGSVEDGVASPSFWGDTDAELSPAHLDMSVLTRLYTALVDPGGP